MKDRQLDRIKVIDGLRFVAIFLVFIQHVQHKYIEQFPAYEMNVLQEINSKLAVGVELFFLISGFVICLQLNQINKFDLNQILNFYGKRISRIWPPYLISLILGSVLLTWYSSIKINEIFEHLLVSSVLIHNLIYGYGSIINPVAWSLEIEIQFYIIAPLIFIISNKFPESYKKYIFISFGILGYILFLIIKKILPDTPIFILLYLPYFMAGAIICQMYLKKLLIQATKFDFLSIFFILIIPILFWLDIRFKVIIISQILCILVYCILRSAYFKYILENTYIAFIGLISYSLYLIHNLILYFFGEKIMEIIKIHNSKVDFLEYFLVMIIIIFPISILFYKKIEIRNRK